MSTAEKIIAVRPAHRFNEAALGDFLRREIEDFPKSMAVHQFGYGQSNPTFLLSGGGREFVLRKKPPGKLLPSAHAVDREYRILKTLNNTLVPVPQVYLLCEDDTIIGTPFYVMERVKGRIFRTPTAPEASDAKERAAIFDAMNDTLAKIHQVDWSALGLADFGKPGNYMQRQVSRWTQQYEASKTEQIESMENLIQWLSEHIPSDDSTAIVHGDFRLENLIIHPMEPRVLAVLDWELSTLGHPLADLAYNCLGYYLLAEGDLRAGYKDLDLATLEIPSETEYVASYCRRTGRSEVPNWKFFIAFSIFRLAAIVQGVYKRGLDGIASSDNAKRYGAQVQFLTDTGWRIVTSR